MRQKKYLLPAFSMLAGFITIFVLNTLSRIFIYREVKGMVQTASTIDTVLYSPVLHTAVALVIPIIGGIVVGFLVTRRGAFYGGLLAIIIKIISIAIISSIFFYPAAFYGIELPQEANYALAQQNILRQLISAPFSILFMAWGGWVGEKIKISFAR